MASILNSLRRRVKSYGDRRALRAFRMPEGYSGGIPGAAAEILAPAGAGGASKAALSAGERVMSVFRARGQGKAMSQNPAAKSRKLAAIPAVAAATAALKTGGTNQLFQGGNTRQDFSLGVRNNLTSNFALQSVNTRYQGASGLAGSGTAPLRADGQSGAFQAAFTGTVAAMGAVSGDGSAYRDFAAASPGAAGASAVVQVEMVNHNAVSSELDLDRVVSYLADKVAEGLQTAAETVHW